MDNQEWSLEKVDHYLKGWGEEKKKNTQLQSQLREAQERIASLEEVKATLGEEEITLKEAEQKFLKSKRAEIERQVEERVNGIKAQIEKEIPSRVQERAEEVLKAPIWPPEIAKMVGRVAENMVASILYHRAKWPGTFQVYFEGEVQREVAERVNFKFKDELYRELMLSLNNVKSTEWRRYVDSRLSDIEGLVRKSYEFSCPVCGQSFQLKITPDVLSTMLAQGYANVTCPNSKCSARIGIDLKEILRTHIGACPDGTRRKVKRRRKPLLTSILGNIGLCSGLHL
jgi:rubrerythrin